MKCLLGAGHDGKHWDLKHDYQWIGPVVYWDDYEQDTEANNQRRVNRSDNFTRDEFGAKSLQYDNVDSETMVVPVQKNARDFAKKMDDDMEDMLKWLDEFAARQGEEWDGQAYYGEF